MRPKTLEEYVGQSHLVGANAPLRVMLERGHIPSMILWGPPGVGKTTQMCIRDSHISSEDGFSFTLATDIGHLTPTIEHYASMAHHLVLESNYDPEMLRIGKYPPFLKKRISGPLGHLSNDESVEFLCRIWRPTMRNVFLCHLSKENNHPELVRKTFDIRLFSEGIRVGKDVYVMPLQRNHCSPMYLLET